MLDDMREKGNNVCHACLSALRGGTTRYTYPRSARRHQVRLTILGSPT
jgi:hypothetical protein